MNTIVFDHGQVKMIAHRGLSGIERENTNAAFVAAGNRSYFGVETDVHKTSDGQFVIIHDESTQRVSAGVHHIDVEKNPISVSREITLPDLDGQVRGDLHIPTLTEYIRICKKYEKICVLELKNPFSREDIHAVLSIIRSLEYLDHVVFISFCLENCIALREMLPRQPIQWLTSMPIDEALIQTLCQYHLDLDTDYTYLTKDIVDRLHDANIQVNCWTCNDPEDGIRMVQMGVDYITTNILE